jgi:hypothetical protein
MNQGAACNKEHPPARGYGPSWHLRQIWVAPRLGLLPNQKGCFPKVNYKKQARRLRIVSAPDPEIPNSRPPDSRFGRETGAGKRGGNPRFPIRPGPGMGEPPFPDAAGNGKRAPDWYSCEGPRTDAPRGPLRARRFRVNEGTSSVRHPQLTAGCPEYLQYGRLLYVALAFLGRQSATRASNLASEGCHSTGQLDMSDTKQTTGTLSNDTLEKIPCLRNSRMAVTVLKEIYVDQAKRVAHDISARLSHWQDPTSAVTLRSRGR